MERERACADLARMRIAILDEEAKRAEQRQLYGNPFMLSAGSDTRPAIFHRSKYSGAPLYVDIHGGGFCWGRVDDGDRFCHRINERLGFAAVSIDYPLTPDAAYPVALEWLFAAIEKLRGSSDELGFDPDRIVIGGRSAGANIAAALCILANQHNGWKPVCQVLDHPWLDLSGFLMMDGRYSRHHVLTPELLDELASAYASDEQRKQPLCSPVLADAEILRDLPGAVIQVCEWDSLREDGECYARMLSDAGVKVVFHCYPGVYHGFTEFENPDMVPGQDWLIEGIDKLVPRNEREGL